MGYYDDADLPFYYDIAKTFAISDRYFCAVIGQTFPNRAYFAAGTSFGHLTTSEIITAGGYKPINGTIYDRLDAAGVSWTDYYTDLPFSLIFTTSAGHTKPDLGSSPPTPPPARCPPSPSSTAPSLVDQIDQRLHCTRPTSIRRRTSGPASTSRRRSSRALRNSPSWNDSILFLTYDEHGGFYDHVMPPAGGAGRAPTRRTASRPDSAPTRRICRRARSRAAA